MQFFFTDIFKKEVKQHAQNNKNLRNRIDECILDFKEHFLDSRYYRKPLKGYEKEDIHELSVGGDPRIFIQIFKKEDECYFLNFGTHASLELKSKKRLRIDLVRKR
ncbi:MAG: hypothetical protein PHH70_02435 [Candidatus Gracilibacteria bacterium]|nr:hypothetical protein [Candidatus Gracilibacteria bacterium]